MDARVAVVTSPNQLNVETRRVPDPATGEALIRVHECGICGSDLKLYGGKHPVVKPPMILGHEFYGSVEALGPGGDGPEPGPSAAGAASTAAAGAPTCAPTWSSSEASARAG
jgi:threonine dehydrogenase-like Zn-dependent dehydrogenase